MKLASYKDGSRDGQLVVVSRDLHLAVHANGIAGRLQAVLDDWNFLAPQLQDLSQTLNHGKARHAFPFDPAMCLAPLPRAPRRLCAAAYDRPADRAADRSARPALSAGTADWALGPVQDLVIDPADGAVEPAVQWAVVTGDIAARSGADAALEGIRLVGLLADWTVRPPDGAPMPPASPTAVLTAWAPVLVTLDELDGAWQRGRLALQLELRRNGGRASRVATGEGMAVHMGTLLGAAARWRPLTAGTLLGSGPIAPIDGPWGDGDRLQAQAVTADGQSVFGAIDQTVVNHD